MPSVSQSQQRYFGAIAGGNIPKPKGMSDKVVQEFASTKRKDLPERVPHKADGMTNTAWQQSEPTSKKRPDWMERAVPHMADGERSSSQWASSKLTTQAAPTKFETNVSKSQQSISPDIQDARNEPFRSSPGPGVGRQTAWPRDNAPAAPGRGGYPLPAPPAMADGRKPISGPAYRPKKTVADSAPAPRTRQYFKTAW